MNDAIPDIKPFYLGEYTVLATTASDRGAAQPGSITISQDNKRMLVSYMNEAGCKHSYAAL